MEWRTRAMVSSTLCPGSCPPSPGFVGFLGNRAVAHGAGGEAFDDLARRFHLFERNRLAGFLQFKQTAQRAELLALRIQQVCILLESGEAFLPDGLLQLENGLRIVEVILAASAVLIVAGEPELGIELGLRRVRVTVFEKGLPADHV